MLSVCGCYYAGTRLGHPAAAAALEELSSLTGQLAQPNPDAVHSKRAAFFNSLKSKIGHIVAKASAMRVNLNLSPAIPSPPRPRPNTSHAPLPYALNLSHHVLPPPGA